MLQDVLGSCTNNKKHQHHWQHTPTHTHTQARVDLLFAFLLCGGFVLSYTPLTLPLRDVAV